MNIELEVKGGELRVVDLSGPTTLATLPLLTLAKALAPIMNKLCVWCQEPDGNHTATCEYRKLTIDIAVVCKQCHGFPPAGEICATCGKMGNPE